jgi:hypothetical protein
MAVEDYGKLLKRTERYARDNAKAMARAEDRCSKSRTLAKMIVQLSSDNITNVVKMGFLTDGLWDQWMSKADRILEIEREIEKLKILEKEAADLRKENKPVRKQIAENIENLRTLGTNMSENGKILAEVLKKL